MKFRPKEKMNMFLRPIAFGPTLKPSKWTWRNGKNKMLFPDERKHQEKLSNIDKYKEILLKEEKTQPNEPTTLLKFLISEGIIKKFI